MMIIPNGNISVIITIESLVGQGAEDIGITEFLNKQNAKYRRYGSDGNPCQGYKITGDVLVFESIGDLQLYNSNITYSKENNSAVLSFFVSVGKFSGVRKSVASVKYALSPLYNYKGPYHESPEALLSHPLLRCKEPIMTIAMLDNDVKKSENTMYANITRFSVQGGEGFIQPFGTNIEQDKQNEDSGCISALLSFDFSMENDNWNSVKESYPFDIFPLLSLSSGKFVGSPLIFLLNETGEAISIFYVRISMMKSTSCYCPFHFINRMHCTKLIGGAMASSMKLNLNIRVALKALIKSEIPSLTIEDQFYFVCRAIEAIWREKRPATEDFEGIPPDAKGLIELKINDLIQDLAGFDQDSVRILVKRLKNIKYKSISFPESIKILLEQYGFPDAKILKKTKWLRDISELRNTSVHGGTPEYDDDNFFIALRTFHHLQDIATRLILKILNYDGEYQPPCVKFRTSVKIDRLSEDSKPTLLGYDEEP